MVPWSPERDGSLFLGNLGLSDLWAFAPDGDAMVCGSDSGWGAMPEAGPEARGRGGLWDRCRDALCMSVRITSAIASVYPVSSRPGAI